MKVDEAYLSSLTSKQAALKQQLEQHRRALQFPSHDHAHRQDSTELTVDIERLQELADSRSKLNLAKTFIQQLSAVAHALETVEKDSSLATLYDAYIQVCDAQDLLLHHVQEPLVVNVIQRVQAAKKQLWSQMEDKVSTGLRKVLVELDWPNDKFDQADHTSFTAVMQDCLMIYVNEAKLPDVLLPFAVLAESISTRFDYHFNSSRPTNRLDKPEWFLKHLLGVIEGKQAIMADEIQEIVDRCLPNHHLDAVHEFVRSILPLAATKLQATSGRVLEDVALLSHVIGEAQNFDDALRSGYGMCERGGSLWRGTTQAILADDVFDAWLGSESAFAQAKLTQLLGDDLAEPSSATVGVWELDQDIEAPDDHPVLANQATTELVALFEAMTDRFSRVVSPAQARKFLKRIQQPMVERFLARVRESAEAFDRLTRGFSGGFPSVDTAGLPGLQRLCRQYASADLLLYKLRDWNVLELYVRSGDDYLGTGALDSLEEDCLDLRQLIWRSLTAHLERELVTIALRGYTKVQTWSSDQAPPSQVASTTAASVQLIRFLELLPQMFGYVVSVLGGVRARALVYATMRACDDLLVDVVVHTHKFSKRGALQLTRDVWEIWAVVAPFVQDPQRTTPRLADVVAVFTAHIKAQVEAEEDPKSATSTTTLQPTHNVPRSKASAIRAQLL